MSKAYQRFHNVGRDVSAGRVEHLTEVREWNLSHRPADIVLIERGPAAVAALHPQHPLSTASNCLFPLMGVFGPDAVQCNEHLSCVVDVRVGVVGELERPSTRCGALDLYLPVAPLGYLGGDEPLCRPAQHRTVGRHARVLQSDHRKAGVPGWRHTSLDAQRVFLLDHEAPKSLHTLAHDRMINAVAEQFERNKRVHPRRLNAAPRTVLFLMVYDPLGCPTDGQSPHWAPGQ